MAPKQTLEIYLHIKPILHLVDGGLVGGEESWYPVSKGDCAAYGHHCIAQGASVLHGSLEDRDFLAGFRIRIPNILS